MAFLCRDNISNRLSSQTNGNSSIATYSDDAHDKLTGISEGTNKTYGYDSLAPARPLLYYNSCKAGAKFGKRLWAGIG